MTGVELIAAERKRQVEEEGWTPEHDDGHTHGELARAAECYMQAAISGFFRNRHAATPPPGWPWDPSWWKPSPDRIRNFVKAGALMAAEIDRLKRAATTPQERQDGEKGDG